MHRDPPAPPAPADLGGLSSWERHLCAPLTGRKIICAFEVLAGMTGQVAKLQRWRAQRPLLIGDGLGTGPLPLEADADIVVVEPDKVESLTEQVRARIRLADRLTPEIVAAVEGYDPDGSAAWWISPVGPNEPLLDREVYGGRPTAQIQLEDKLLLDAILTAVGAPKAPSEVAQASYPSLLSASERVADAAPGQRRHVVWAGDSRDGLNGGGDYVRAVDLDARSADNAVSAAEFFAAHCDRVRVSPLLEGVPCSIHGLVLPDGIVALRPVELVNLLKPETGTFFYGGMATSWDPPTADTDEMRGLVRRVGQHLCDEHGLRGAFGIDGVLTTEGFRVTEINPRFSGGLTRLANAAPEVHLDLVQINALIGREIGRAAADIEAEAMARLDETRVVDMMGLSAAVRTADTTYQPVAVGESGLEAVDEGGEAIGAVLRGASSMGTFIRLTVDDSVVGRGQRSAPLALLMLDFADRMWDTQFGPLSMPTEVRRPSVPGVQPTTAQ